MIARDYWNMRRATRKDKNSVETYIRNLDLHDPTPYDKLIAKHNIPVGVDQKTADSLREEYGIEARVLDEEEKKENG